MAFASWQFAYDNDMKSKTTAATNNCSKQGDPSPNNNDAHRLLEHEISETQNKTGSKFN